MKEKIPFSQKINTFFISVFGSLWYALSNFLSGTILYGLLWLFTWILNQLPMQEKDIIDLIANYILKGLNYLILVVFAGYGVISAILANHKNLKKQIDELNDEESDYFDSNALPGKVAEKTKILQDSMPKNGEVESVDPVFDKKEKFESDTDDIESMEETN